MAATKKKKAPAKKAPAKKAPAKKAASAEDRSAPQRGRPEQVEKRLRKGWCTVPQLCEEFETKPANIAGDLNKIRRKLETDGAEEVKRENTGESEGPRYKYRIAKVA